VADRYIDVALVDAAIGRSVRESLVGDDAAPGELLIVIELATALVQSYLRNSGYATPATQDPTEILDGTVKLAVVGAVWEMLAEKPDNSLQLPDNWATSMYRVALDGILSGSVVLNLTQNLGNAPGGITVSSRASRATDLSGW
jgi:hypothetical protein